MRTEPEVGIYEKKQESEKKRKKTRSLFDQKKVFKLKKYQSFNFQALKIIFVICRFDQIEYI